MLSGPNTSLAVKLVNRSQVFTARDVNDLKGCSCGISCPPKPRQLCFALCALPKSASYVLVRQDKRYMPMSVSRSETLLVNAVALEFLVQKNRGYQRITCFLPYCSAYPRKYVKTWITNTGEPLLGHDDSLMAELTSSI